MFLGLIALGSAGYAGVDPVRCEGEEVPKPLKQVDHRKGLREETPKKLNAAKLAADLSKSESKFDKAFSKAEAKGSARPLATAARSRQRSRTSSGNPLWG